MQSLFLLVNSLGTTIRFPIQPLQVVSGRRHQSSWWKPIASPLHARVGAAFPLQDRQRYPLLPKCDIGCKPVKPSQAHSFQAGLSLGRPSRIRLVRAPRIRSRETLDRAARHCASISQSPQRMKRFRFIASGDLAFNGNGFFPPRTTTPSCSPISLAIR